MEQTLVADGLPKETVAAIMMLNKTTKVKVRSLDGQTDIFLNSRRCPAMRHVSLILDHNLPGLRNSNVDRFNERKLLEIWQRQKAENNLHKELRIQTTLMTISPCRC